VRLLVDGIPEHWAEFGVRKDATMRTLLFIGALLLVPLLHLDAAAQTEAKGDWRCANDKDDSVRLDEPAQKVAEGSRDFAQGDAKAILGKGGPSGVFLWAHLHAIHPDRNGSSRYKIAVLVRDEGGWYYMAAPLLDAKVDGVLDKPKRHRHCFGQFRLPPGDDADALREAVNGNVKLTVEVYGDRNNGGILADLPEEAKKVIGKYLGEQVGQYLAGKITAKDLLHNLNAGKSPKKP
jgi:hypothetical protein